MELYKKRNFSDLISDTFNFFKKYGRNFIYNYLTVNGGIMILFLLTIVIGYGEFIQQLIGGNISGETYYLEEYFTNNQGVLIITSVIAFLLLFLMMLIAFSFPVLYLKIIGETGKESISITEMVDAMKANAGKLIKFYFGTLFIVGPIAAILFAVFSLLAMLIIGFVFILLFIPVIVNIVNLSLFHILHTDSGYFASLSYAYKAQFSKSFWKYIGATAIIYIIINTISYIFMIIPAVLIIVFSFTLFEDPSTTGPPTFFFVLIFFTYLISIIVTFILANLSYVSIGLMYFDSRDDLQREVTISEIDQIGLGE